MHSDNEMVKLRDVVETLIYMTDEDSDGVEEVMQLPTIDIVTCGECKHSTGHMCKRIKWAPCYIDLNGFCSYGEPRESEYVAKD